MGDDLNTSLRDNMKLYMETVTDALNKSGLQYVFPDRHGYVSLDALNLTSTDDGGVGFNFNLWNQTVYNGIMTQCTRPTVTLNDPSGGGGSWADSTSAAGEAFKGWGISGAGRRNGIGECNLWVSILGFMMLNIIFMPYLKHRALAR